MSETQKQKKLDDLYELLAGIDNPRDCRALLEDLCTVKEIENMAERVYAARLMM